jgi:hypothetical protein
MSPLLLVLLPSLLTVLLCGRKSPRMRVPGRLLLTLLLPGILFLGWNFCIKTPRYVSHYSHFSELTRAKIKFHNVKPRDPDLLSYDARMMWTPAMHSADWKILTTFFPSFGVIGIRTPVKAWNNVIAWIPFSLGLFYLLLLCARSR